MNQEKTIKIHIGCGTVYLKDYINVDVQLDHHFLSKDRKDIVEQNITTIESYYKYPVTRKEIESCELRKKEVVVDQFGTAFNLPFTSNAVNEIRSVQVFEHFTYEEGARLLKYWKNLLKEGGVIHIDIPDLDGTVKGYLDSETEEDKNWFVRLLFGSQKNMYGLHRSMYSKEMITKLLLDSGFSEVKILPNIHFYPAFAVEAIK